MRLIDADALKDRLKKLVRDGVNINYDIDGTIDRAVTITPERKRGKWIDRSGGIGSSWNYCSVCGEREIYPYDFCPNCGAYMGEDEE